MKIYADSSFIVSAYAADAHSAKADLSMSRLGGTWLTKLQKAEFVHAVERSVFRRDISAGQADAIHKNLEADCKHGLWVEVNVPEGAFDKAIELARAYASKFGMRTLDTLHVACALELGARELWTFDDRQAGLAKAVGLKVS